MDIVIIVVIITAAFVVPWMTISAFEHSRLAGWLTTFVAMMAHVATWAIMAHSKEAAFFFAAPWAAYEFILTLIPMGIGEEEAAKAANKG